MSRGWKRAPALGAAMAAACLTTPAWAAEPASPYGKVHEFGDWAVACDNTHRCEAVGYQPKDNDDAPVALFLSREAGPGSAVRAKFFLGETDGTEDPVLTLAIGPLRLTGLQPGQPLTPKQVASLLPLLNKEHEARLSDGKQRWTLSLAGATAALLKMDDLQGRIGTPGAIVRPGKRAESSVPAPLAAPVFVVHALPAARAADQALTGPILAAVKPGDFCEDAEVGKANISQAEIVRVSASQVIVTSMCWQAAYQSGWGAWLSNDKPPYAPQRLAFPDAQGNLEREPTELSIETDGRAHSAHKGRGIGDCFHSSEWAWTGRGFLLTKLENDAACRGLTGGVPLTLWRAAQGPAPR